MNLKARRSQVDITIADSKQFVGDAIECKRRADHNTEHADDVREAAAMFLSDIATERRPMSIMPYVHFLGSYRQHVLLCGCEPQLVHEEEIKGPEGTFIWQCLHPLARHIECIHKHCHQCEIETPADDIQQQQRDANQQVWTCSNCKQELAMNNIIKHEHGVQIKGPKGWLRSEGNLLLVLAAASVGGTAATLSTILNAYGMRGLHHRSFAKTLQQVTLPRNPNITNAYLLKALTNRTFEQICDAQNCALVSAMDANIIEERQQAIAHGHVETIEGMPSPILRVIADGSYSKQSHKHSYSSMSAVVVLIGHHTNKLMWFGVLNRYCAMCVRGKKPPCTCPPATAASCKIHHRCYKNWNSSAKSMEVELVKQAFSAINSGGGFDRYACKIKYLIGDGDASVMKALRSSWNFVEKIECANHAIKAYRGHIETLLSAHPEWRAIVTTLLASKIVSGARCAVKQRSEQMTSKVKSRVDAARALEADLVNGICHYLGIHNYCSETYCGFQRHSAVTNKIVQQLNMGATSTEYQTQTVAATPEEDKANESSKRDDDSEDDDDEQGEITLQDAKRRLEFAAKPATQVLMDSQSMLEDLITTIGTQKCGTEKSIDEVFSAPQSINTQFMKLLESNPASAKQLVCEMQTLARTLARKDLVDNCTTNAAESWFNVKQVLEGGKKRNLIQAGSFEQRMHMLGMRVLYEHEWLTTMYQNVFACDKAPTMMSTAAERKQRKQLATKARQKQPKYKLNRHLSRRGKAKKFDEELGIYHGDADPDLGRLDTLHDDALRNKMTSFQNTMYNLSTEELSRIQKTKQRSEMWRSARRVRVTASLAGRICKSRETTHRGNLVTLLTNPSQRMTHAMKTGIDVECNIIDLYIMKKFGEGESVSVKRTGLLVHPSQQWLGASPDGVVTSTTSGQGLVEVKYMYSMAQRKLTVSQAVDFASIAANKVKDFCLESVSGKIQLKVPGAKRNAHDYYYQIQMQLHVANLEWCDFVCCTAHVSDIQTYKPEFVHVERVFRDKQFWDLKMQPQLHAFFHEALLPELAAPHGDYNLGSVGPRDLDKRRARRKDCVVKTEQSATSSTVVATRPESIEISTAEPMNVDGDEYIGTPKMSQAGGKRPKSDSDETGETIARAKKPRSLPRPKASRMFPSSDEEDSGAGVSEASPVPKRTSARRHAATKVEVVEVSSDSDSDSGEKPRQTALRALRERGIAADPTASMEELATMLRSSVTPTYEARMDYFRRHSIQYPSPRGAFAPPLFRQRAGLARLWDYLGLSGSLASTLAYFGFNVIGTASHKRQENLACGYVAARVASTFPVANWITFDASRCVDKSWVVEGNRILGLPHGGDAIFISTSQVAHLVREWGGKERYCSTCIQSADQFVVELAKNLSKSEPDNAIKLRIVNTEDSNSLGLHWITIAYTLSDRKTT
jgi:hypothetical protein